MKFPLYFDTYKENYIVIVQVKKKVLKISVVGCFLSLCGIVTVDSIKLSAMCFLTLVTVRQMN